MLVSKAGQLGFGTIVLDPTEDSPAGQLATREVQAAFDDAAALSELVQSADITTYEIEHIAVAPLEALADAGL